tara:strand:+ start:2350 stop:3009 length:660 start_codon:yes stop_codon:yes gene_type:complete
MKQFAEESQNIKFTKYCNHLKIKGVTFVTIYNKLGITNQQFIRIKKGSSRAKEIYLNRIEADFKKELSDFNDYNLVKSNDRKLVAIPLYKLNFMDHNLDADFLLQPGNKENYGNNITIPNFTDGRSAITIFGDGGAPRYNGGDIIILAEKINVDDEIEFGRFYIVITKTARYIKKIMPCTNMECITLVSENVIYPPMDVMRKNVKGLLKVLGKIQREGF